MPQYILAYHGGARPKDPQNFMARWRAWSDGLGTAKITPGNPCGMSKTITADGVEDNGGPNPLAGYTIIEAPDIDAAIAMAQPCPHLEHGTIEVAELMDMEM